MTTETLEELVEKFNAHITDIDKKHRSSYEEHPKSSWFYYKIKQFEDDLRLASAAVLKIVKDINIGNFTISLVGKPLFSEVDGVCEYAGMTSVPSFNPDNHITTYLELLVTVGNIIIYAYLDNDGIRLNRTDTISREHFRFLSDSPFIQDKLRPSVRKLYDTEIAPKLSKYMKAKQSRDKSFEKNAPRIAMKKISKFIYDNKLNFTREELKAVIPIMIIKQQELASLVGWFDRNQKLRDKFTDETIEQIVDNVTIMDILE